MRQPPRVSGVSAASAFGRGTSALRDGVLAGRPAFRPVDRFAVDGRRVRVAAALPGRPVLADELVAVVTEACDDAGLGTTTRAGTPLLLAVHADPDAARDAGGERSAGAFANVIARSCGLAPTSRAYTTACVAGTSALADAAAMIMRGGCDRVVVAAGYLVESDQFALFDAGRVLAVDDAVRPFSAERKGILLGDGVAAIVVESADAARGRAHEPLGVLAGWGRTGDAYHVVQPRPDGEGLSRAVAAALRRGGVETGQIGYLNAHGTGTAQSDAAESAALTRAFGDHARALPVSSTKSTHGHALEASGLLEVVVTLLALRAGRLPVNAGFLAPDADCDLNLVLDGGPLDTRYALSVNSAFGGANTAILVGAA